MSKRLSLKQKELLRKNQYILKRLAYAKGKERKIILDNSPRELFQALSLVLRILSDQKLPYNDYKDEENIKKHRRFIQSTRDLKQNAINRKLKSQHGGFLSAILSAALPLISSLIGKLI